MIIGGNMSDYIRPGTQFPKYFQFPAFLLRAPISHTAKLAYMVLYDRAMCSREYARGVSKG